MCVCDDAKASSHIFSWNQQRKKPSFVDYDYHLHASIISLVGKCGLGALCGRFFQVGRQVGGAFF